MTFLALSNCILQYITCKYIWIWSIYIYIWYLYYMPLCFVGPFLTALLTKLEGMIQNPFAVNFLLTGIISRLAAFPQPLLRSFLLSHNLVFQPTVKSLLQVYYICMIRMFALFLRKSMFCWFPCIQSLWTQP